MFSLKYLIIVNNLTIYSYIILLHVISFPAVYLHQYNLRCFHNLCGFFHINVFVFESLGTVRHEMALFGTVRHGSVR